MLRDAGQLCLGELGHLHHRLEAQRLRHSQVRQDFAVERHVALGQVAHHYGVRKAVHSGSSIDTLDPESSVVSFPDLKYEGTLGYTAP